MSLASNVSTGAFIFNFMFMIVLVQFMGGGLTNACNAFGFFDISLESCQSMGKTFLGSRPTDAMKDFMSLALVFPRVESCLFLGMGMGSVYAFLFLARGTKEVAVIHFMHAIWATTVCLCHAQNAGLLSGMGVEPEANVLSSEKLAPFVVMTGAQAATYWAAFFLSNGVEPPKPKKN